MSDEPDAQERIVTEAEFDEPPEKVWRALTEPALVDKWLGRGGDLAPDTREVVEAEPERRLKVVWRNDKVESDVAFDLTETREGGTRLRVVHDGFRIPTSSNLKMAA